MKKPTPPKPPVGLSNKAVTLWRTVVKDFDIIDAPGLMLLESAMRCWDRAHDARAVIEREGMQVADRFGSMKPHGLLSVERDAWAGFRHAIKQLGFDIEAPRPAPGRPPGV